MDALYDVDESVNTEQEAEMPESESVDEAPAEVSEDNGDGDEGGVDYEALIASDIAALKAEFPELKGITDITELNNPLRYAALRDLGLTPTEAYMATAKRRTQDTRSHLKSAHGKGAAVSAGMMSQLELATARELFPGKNDAELQRLYKRVSR
jgi:hypothetical protein